MINLVKKIWILLVIVGITGCVTTTSSSFTKQKDLKKAELTYIEIGFAHIQRENYLEARKALDNALDLNPKASGAHLGYALIYAREEESALAHKSFKTAIRYDETQDSRYRYGIYLFQHEDYDAAKKAFTKVAEDTRFIYRASTFDFLGLLQSGSKNTKRPLPIFRKRQH